MVDSDVGALALVLKVETPLLALGCHVLLVHQLDQHRVAGPKALQGSDLEPAHGSKAHREAGAVYVHAAHGC